METWTFYAGESIEKTIHAPQYLAPEWEAQLSFSCLSTRRIFSATNQNGSHRFTISATESSAFRAGIYDVVVIARKGEESRVIFESQAIIKEDPFAAEPAKSALESQLELVDKAIDGVLSGEGVQSYQIQTAVGSRQITRMNLQDLRDHRNWLLRKIDAEREQVGKARRSSGFQKIGIKFSN